MRGKRLSVGLYLDSPQANVLRLVRCLRDWDMSFVSVWRDELVSINPGSFDVLLLHGGWYGLNRVPGQEQHQVVAGGQDKRRGASVRKFVKGGGGVVGVCAGAFNVIWLGLVDAEISRTEGVGPHSLDVANEKHPICRGVIKRASGRKDRRWQSVPAIRVNGPVFFPRKKEEMIFSYDWEKRLGAVLASVYGKGRVVAISPHLERTANDLATSIPDEELMASSLILRNAVEWAGQHSSCR